MRIVDGGHGGSKRSQNGPHGSLGPFSLLSTTPALALVKRVIARVELMVKIPSPNVESSKKASPAGLPDL